MFARWTIFPETVIFFKDVTKFCIADVATAPYRPWPPCTSWVADGPSGAGPAQVMAQHLIHLNPKQPSTAFRPSIARITEPLIFFFVHKYILPGGHVVCSATRSRALPPTVGFGTFFCQFGGILLVEQMTQTSACPLRAARRAGLLAVIGLTTASCVL